MLGYISTRDQAPRLGFTETMLTGLARDGGLYVPETCPKLPPEELATMAQKPYLEIAWRVILPFIGKIPLMDLNKILKAAYKNFDHSDIAPLHQLGDNFYLMELFHGPTLAFKDIALQFLGQLFEYTLAKKGQKITIVGATSGDTGSAALEAFKGRENTNIFILHPHNRVSEVQRRQMTTVKAPNVFNIAVEGSFDDCQDLVKAMFNDEKFRDELHLSAINSINWARIMAQVVYYAFAASRIGKPVTFCVPTGNFGNVYAGYIAQSMGVAIEKLVIATNKNDILHRFLETGQMKMEAVAPTLSPSMDIQISSNFERLLFDLYGHNGSVVDKAMKNFRESGSLQLDAGIMARVKKNFASGKLDDGQTLGVMQHIYQQKKYIMDPHTAVGVGVAAEYRKKNPQSIIVSLATAHPAKFPEAVKKAIGIEPPLPPQLANIYKLAEKYDVLPKDLAKIQKFIRDRVKM